MNNTTTKVVDSGIKVNLGNTATKSPKVFVERKISSDVIGQEIAGRITGTTKLLGFDDLYDVATKRFLTESELKSKGAVFITLNMDKVLTIGKDTVKKSRSDKEILTPFIRKTNSVQYIININWESFVNRRGHGDFVANTERSNGVVNAYECKAVGKTKAGDTTINGVVFKTLQQNQYFDINGDLFADQKQLKADFLKGSSNESKQKEADKHGIAIEFDPQYRTTRLDNCGKARVFGFDYLPTDNNS